MAKKKKRMVWDEGRDQKLRMAISGKLTRHEIAEKFGVSYSSLSQRLKKLGLTKCRSGQSEPEIPKSHRSRRGGRYIRVGFDCTQDEKRKIDAAAVLTGHSPGRFMETAIGNSETIKRCVLRAAEKILKKAVT